MGKEEGAADSEEAMVEAMVEDSHGPVKEARRLEAQTRSPRVR